MQTDLEILCFDNVFWSVMLVWIIGSILVAIKSSQNYGHTSPNATDDSCVKWCAKNL